MTRACRTTLTVALQVIAGMKPMELELIENVLVKFLAYILGDYCDVYTKDGDGKTIYDDYFGNSEGEGNKVNSQITKILKFILHWG